MENIENGYIQTCEPLIYGEPQKPNQEEWVKAREADFNPT